MPRIKNMGTATMRFGEGIIVSGSAGSDVYTIVATGSVKASENIYTDKDLYVGYNDTTADAGAIFFSDAGASGGPSIKCSTGGTILNVDGDNYVYLTADVRVSTYAPNIYLNAGLESACQLFLFGSENTKYLLSAQASTDQVLILSGCGGGPTSPNESAYGDMAFFVSGAIGSKGTASKGTALFGGDLVTSGGIYINATAPTLTIQRKDNSNNSNIDFQGSGGTVGLRMSFIADENHLAFSNWTGSALEETMRIKSDGNVGIGTSSPQTALHVVGGTDASRASATSGFLVLGETNSTNMVLDQNEIIARNNGGTNHLYIQNESGNVMIGDYSGVVPAEQLEVVGNIKATGNLYVADSAGMYTDKIRRYSDSDNTTKILLNDELIKLYAGHSSKNICSIGPNSSGGTDSNFFVSGSIDSRSTSTSGTAVFGGDLVVSGNVNIEDTLRVNEYITCRTDTNTSIRFNGSDTMQLRAGGTTMIQLTEGSDDAVYINPDKNPMDLFFYHDSSNNNARVFMLGNGASADETNYADLSFFVSGSIDSRGGTSKGTAVFGGDVVISGSLYTKQRHITTNKYNSSDSNQIYVRFDAAGENGSPGVNNKFVVPADRKLLSVTIRATSAADSTEVKFHKNTDGNANLNTTATDTRIIDISAAHTSYTTHFTPGAVFDAGNIVGISINPTNTPNDVNVTAVWEFNFVS